MDSVASRQGVVKRGSDCEFDDSLDVVGRSLGGAQPCIGFVHSISALAANFEPLAEPYFEFDVRLRVVRGPALPGAGPDLRVVDQEDARTRQVAASFIDSVARSL